MSGWPWMQGVDCAIADPIEPVDSDDERPSVKALIAENRESIDRIHNELSADPLYEADKHDDLWALRFILTHKKVKAAAKAAKATLIFRREHRLDDQDIRAHSPHDRSSVENKALQRYIAGGVEDDGVRFIVPDPKRGVVAFLKASSIDPHRLVKNVDTEDWLPAFGYMSEWSFQWVDYVARTTGLFTKTIRVVDAGDIGMSYMNRENQKRDAAVAKKLINYYPQLLHKIFIFDAPSFIQYPWKLARHMIPKSVVDKIDFVDPSRRDKECKKILHYISAKHLPARYGGTYRQWPVECHPPVRM
jgi:hypothetical protein